MIAKQVAELKEGAKYDMQQVRFKTLNDLERIFNLASELARGRVKTQTEGGKTEKVTLRERQRWLLVAKKIAETMNSAASNLEEDKINTHLEELEQLVEEAKAKAEKGRAEERTQAQKGKTRVEKSEPNPNIEPTQA